MPRMDERVRRLAEQLLDSGFDKLSERERRVITRIADRGRISRNVNRVFDERQTFGDRLADCVAGFGGSWTFIVLFLVTLVAWTALNSVVLGWHSAAFDPYPYTGQHGQAANPGACARERRRLPIETRAEEMSDGTAGSPRHHSRPSYGGRQAARWARRRLPLAGGRCAPPSQGYWPRREPLGGSRPPSR